MSNFDKRKNDIFNSLECAEKSMISKDSILDQSHQKNDLLSSTNSSMQKYYNTKNFQGKSKESIFKTPALPISKCLKPRVKPDFQKNPQKWKKYTLADVDISDQTNISAAFDFMRSVEKQRQKEFDSEYEDCKELAGKITFNKSAHVKRNLRSASSTDDESDKPKLKGSKLVMPEYVVGQRIKATSRSKKQNKSPGKQMLNLSHLMEEDE